MSTDFSVKPVGAPVATPIVQHTSHAASEAVATELPATKTVTAADASAVGSALQFASGNVSRQVVLDRAAASYVFQVVDDRTNTVVQQFPDEAVLRRRAYFHALDLTKSEPGRPLATDVKA